MDGRKRYGGSMMYIYYISSAGQARSNGTANAFNSIHLFILFSPNNRI